jgi:hypothetical protein
LSDEDGISACQSRVLQVCVSNLRKHTGECCDDASSCCDEECPDTGGSLNQVSGQCVCNGGAANIDEVFQIAGCDTTCQDSLGTVHFDCDTGTMFTRDADGNELYEGANSDFEIGNGGVFYEANLGDMACCHTDAGCTMQAVEMSSDGKATGVVGFMPSEALAERRQRRGRNLQTTSDEGVAVENPVICIQVGEAVLFDIEPGTQAFPEYHKSSLLNSNADFDYGAFRRLAEIAANTSMFVFSFPDGGVYVFWDGNSTQSQSIVVAMPEGSSCPEGLPAVFPLSTTTLTSLGLVLEEDNITLSADWTGIIIALAALFVLVIACLVSTCCVHRRQWNTKAANEPWFRMDAQDVPLQQYHSKGSFLRRVIPASDREVFNEVEKEKKKEKRCR